jgi:hypothetical protein
MTVGKVENELVARSLKSLTEKEKCMKAKSLILVHQKSGRVIFELNMIQNQHFYPLNILDYANAMKSLMQGKISNLPIMSLDSHDYNFCDFNCKDCLAVDTREWAKDNLGFVNFDPDQYEKVLIGLNEFEQKSQKGKTGKFDFLKEYVDTLESGSTILPIIEKEKTETILYRKNPESEKRIIRGQRSSGIDEILTQDGVQQFLDEVFKDVDIFQNNIPLFLQRFVSPVSSIAPNYYKYYLMDTLMVNNQTCVDLGFVPFNSETFGFTGHLYVTLDSTYFVQKVILNVPKDISMDLFVNLNNHHNLLILSIIHHLMMKYHYYLILLIY